MQQAAVTVEEFREQAKKAADLLKAMSNETRLMILCRLRDGEASAGKLQADYNLSQSAISQHLAILRSTGLVATRRESQTIYYRIADPAAVKVIMTLISIYCPDM